MIKIQPKLPTVPQSIFSIMSALAQKENALNLSQGFPDFESDPHLMELVFKAMKNGNNQYAPMPGIFSLRNKIAQKVEKTYGVSYNPENEITVTAGATQAIFTAIAACVKPNDEVIIFKPAYDSYEPSIHLFGGIVKSIQLDPETFIIDWNEVRNLITSKTKMVIINSPHNPSGRLFLKEDMLALQAILKGTHIILLSDEVYEHIIFDGEQHQSAALFPSLAERAFIVSSFGKTFHNTGWKLGYCVAPKDLMTEFWKVHQYNVFSVHHPTQVALAEYLQNENNYLNLGYFYQQKRNLFLSLIKDSRFEFAPSKGTYFQLLNYKNITAEKDTEFAIRLAKEFKLASIPISVFNNADFETSVLRFCFAKKDETIKEAAAIICSI